MIWFIAENGVLVNMILADSKEIAEAVTGLTAIAFDDESVAGASIGAKLDSKTGVYVNPETSEQ